MTSAMPDLRLPSQPLDVTIIFREGWQWANE